MSTRAPEIRVSLPKVAPQIGGFGDGGGKAVALISSAPDFSRNIGFKIPTGGEKQNVDTASNSQHTKQDSPKPFSLESRNHREDISIAGEFNVSKKGIIFETVTPSQPFKDFDTGPQDKMTIRRGQEQVYRKKGSKDVFSLAKTSPEEVVQVHRNGLGETVRFEAVKMKAPERGTKESAQAQITSALHKDIQVKVATTPSVKSERINITELKKHSKFAEWSRNVEARYGKKAMVKVANQQVEGQIDAVESVAPIVAVEPVIHKIAQPVLVQEVATKTPTSQVDTAETQAIVVSEPEKFSIAENVAQTNNSNIAQVTEEVNLESIAVPVVIQAPQNNDLVVTVEPQANKLAISVQMIEPEPLQIVADSVSITDAQNKATERNVSQLKPQITKTKDTDMQLAVQSADIHIQSEDVIAQPEEQVTNPLLDAFLATYLPEVTPVKAAADAQESKSDREEVVSSATILEEQVQIIVVEDENIAEPIDLPVVELTSSDEMKVVVHEDRKEEFTIDVERALTFATKHANAWSLSPEAALVRIVPDLERKWESNSVLVRLPEPQLLEDVMTIPETSMVPDIATDRLQDLRLSKQTLELMLLQHQEIMSKETEEEEDEDGKKKKRGYRLQLDKKTYRYREALLLRAIALIADELNQEQYISGKLIMFPTQEEIGQRQINDSSAQISKYMPIGQTLDIESELIGQIDADQNLLKDDGYSATLIDLDHIGTFTDAQQAKRAGIKVLNTHLPVIAVAENNVTDIELGETHVQDIIGLREYRVKDVA